MIGSKLRTWPARLALIVGLSTCSPISAEEPQSILDEKLTRAVKQGIAHNYNLDYEEAIRTFQQIIQDNPQSPIGYAYLSFTLWIKELNAQRELSIDRFSSHEFFSEHKHSKMRVDPQFEKEFRQTTQKAIDTAKVLLKKKGDDPASTFMLGMAYGNLASFEATLKRSWWQAFRNGARAEKYHRQLLQVEPPVYDVYQTIGVSDYVIGSLPAKVRWLAAAFAHRGDKERGKQELRLVTQRGIFFKDDSAILLALIYIREKNFQEAYALLQGLLDKYPKNYLLAMDLGGIALIMDNFDLAAGNYETVLKKISSGVPNFNLLDKGLVNNRLGDVYMKKKDYPKAQAYYQRTISEDNSETEAASFAHLALGKIYDLTGKRSEALSEYKTILRRADAGGIHDEARKYSRKPYNLGP